LEAAAGIICRVIAWMPLGELAVERARRIGALTIFAPPSRS
jgi:hypothetical protein